MSIDRGTRSNRERVPTADRDAEENPARVAEVSRIFRVGDEVSLLWRIVCPAAGLVKMNSCVSI